MEPSPSVTVFPPVRLHKRSWRINIKDHLVDVLPDARPRAPRQRSPFTTGTTSTSTASVVSFLMCDTKTGKGASTSFTLLRKALVLCLCSSSHSLRSFGLWRSSVSGCCPLGRSEAHEQLSPHCNAIPYPPYLSQRRQCRHTRAIPKKDEKKQEQKVFLLPNWLRE